MINIIIGQSGGPTVAINASLAGAIACGYFYSDEVDKIYGAINGIDGVINGKIIDIGLQYSVEKDEQLLCATPAMALGSCRRKLPENLEDDIYDIIFKNLDTLNIGAFVYIGGNDSMDTVLKLSNAVKLRNKNIKFIGCPKTIDNDLPITDHTPGYGSAAKYISTAMMEIIRDCYIYNAKTVTIVEIMGRNAGWLTAAAALPRKFGETAPHLIYLPETVFDIDKFIDDIRSLQQNTNNIIIAVSEGIKTAEGKYVGESAQCGVVDVFGHKYLSGTGKYLENIVRNRLGCKVRSIELNVLQRAASHIASKLDIDESFNIGYDAMERALQGESGKVAIFVRKECNGEYLSEIQFVDISLIANQEKLVPTEWFGENNVADELLDYIYPLIQGENITFYKNGLPLHFIFDKSLSVL